ncbi:MAG: type II secretion system F family protein, partial [Acidobacteria bacterium]|nr:type II secretion system F family protein [Acidobacteriota bacterium]
MSPAIFAVMVFALVVVVVLGADIGIKRMPGALQRRRLEWRIREVVAPEADGTAQRSVSTLVKNPLRGPLPALDRFAGGTLKGSALRKWLEQSGMKISVSGLVVISFVLAVLVAFLGVIVLHRVVAMVGGFLVGGMIPFLVVRIRRARRLHRFEENFPEALDLISRAVRAGHAFTTGMKMVADELTDPVGPEFKKAFEEQNFGLPLKDALNNLSERVPLLDVRFFVTAVLIQRETGGNLSEILDNLGHVVRERFKILRQVRVYTAHGRFTGYV